MSPPLRCSTPDFVAAELHLWHARDEAHCHCAGLLETAIWNYTQLLTSLQPGACSGLYACLLLKRAVALSQKQEYDAALQSLDSALKWEPESADCLQLRAEVLLSADVKLCCAYFLYLITEWRRHACMHGLLHKLLTRRPIDM